MINPISTFTYCSPVSTGPTATVDQPFQTFPATPVQETTNSTFTYYSPVSTGPTATVDQPFQTFPETPVQETTNPTSTYYAPVSEEPTPKAEQPLQTFPEILVRKNRAQPAPHNPLAGRELHRKTLSQEKNPRQNLSPPNAVAQPNLACAEIAPTSPSIHSPPQETSKSDNSPSPKTTESDYSPSSKMPESKKESTSKSSCCPLS